MLFCKSLAYAGCWLTQETNCCVPPLTELPTAADSLPEIKSPKTPVGTSVAMNIFIHVCASLIQTWIISKLTNLCLSGHIRHFGSLWVRNVWTRKADQSCDTTWHKTFELRSVPPADCETIRCFRFDVKAAKTWWVDSHLTNLWQQVVVVSLLGWPHLLYY